MEARDCYRRSCLHYAAMFGNQPVAFMLLRAGADDSVYVWHVEAYGERGKYGPLFPAPISEDARGTITPSPATMRSMLGVNGIWAWENQGWSAAVRLLCVCIPDANTLTPHRTLVVPG